MHALSNIWDRPISPGISTPLVLRVGIDNFVLSGPHIWMVEVPKGNNIQLMILLDFQFIPDVLLFDGLGGVSVSMRDQPCLMNTGISSIGQFTSTVFPPSKHSSLFKAFHCGPLGR